MARVEAAVTVEEGMAKEAEAMERVGSLAGVLAAEVAASKPTHAVICPK